jgi:hypothetical protein
MAAVQGASYNDDVASTVSDSDDEVEVVPESRQEKLERLSKEYEEEVARTKAAADAGEGCLFCSS